MFSSERILGSLAGGAIGDAIGGVAERGVLSLSDDTQLTLATCEAILEAREVEPASIASAMLRWFRARRVSGIGSATLKAMRDLDAGGHWALAGARGEMAAGNGAAMRIAPLAFVLSPLDLGCRTTIRNVCRITHHSDEAYIGALAVLLAIHFEIKSQQDFLAAVAGQLPDSRVRDRLVEFSTLPGSIEFSSVARSFGASGYVVDTVPLALLLAFGLVRNFVDRMHEAAAVPGDMDTVCAIAGQIAGAHLGFACLPNDLLLLAPVAEAVTSARSFATGIGSDA